MATRASLQVNASSAPRSVPPAVWLLTGALGVAALPACGVPPVVLYQAASGAALLCEVVAGVVHRCYAEEQAGAASRPVIVEDGK